MESGKSSELSITKATESASAFVKHYYSSIDSKSTDRSNQVYKLYSPTSRITWNGNPIPYSDLTTFIERLPLSNHEVQAFDCHPIPGTSISSSTPPSLVVSVTGQVTHGPLPPPSSSNSGHVHSKDFDFLPRVFNQSFILISSSSGGRIDSNGMVESSYSIAADAFRFC